MNRTIGVWGISSHEEHLIKCLLQLLESRTTDEWMLSDGDTAQVIIVNANADAAYRPESYGRPVVEYSADTDHEAEFTLHRPIRSSELLRLLNRLSDALDSAEVSTAFDSESDGPGARMHFDRPDTKTIIGRIRDKLGISG